MPTSPLARLGAFRTELHACCTRRADALFELGDALLCTQAFSSLPHLSLEPIHRRGWGSAYAALACGRVDVERLRDLLASCLPDADPLVFAVDVTTWPRCDAECSPGRGYYHPPGIRLVSRSSPAGPTSGSANSASTAICGPPRSTRPGCTRPRTPTRLPPARSVRSWHAYPPAASHRCSSSMAAMTPPSSPSTWLTCPSRCWCGCAPTAASTPTQHQRRARPRAVGRAATAPSSTAPTRPPGRPRPPPWPARTTSTAPSPSTPGAACIPSSSATPAMAAAGPGRSCAAHPPRPGPAGPRPHPPTQGAVAVVGRPRRGGPQSGVAGLGSPVRHRAHRPLRQADPRLDHPTAPPSRPSRPVDLAGTGRLRPATPGPRDRRRPAAAVGAAPPCRSAVAAASAPRGSAASRRARLAGCHTKTRRLLPRPAQGQPLRARAPPPGDQEIRQEGQQDAAQGREGGLTGPDQHHPTAGTASSKPRTPTGLNHKLSEHAAKTGKRSELLCRGHKLRLAELVPVAHELHRVLLR